jgi:hypothetical protein
MTESLPSLLPVRLVVLEGKPARSLIRARLPANPAIAAREQDAPEGNCSEERGAEGSETEGQHARLGPHGVAVEGVDGVEDGGNGKCGKSVRGFRVGVGGCCAYKSLVGG